MDFHGIDMQGPFITERVSVIPPAQEAIDEPGRFIFNLADETTYVGTSTGWRGVVGTGPGITNHSQLQGLLNDDHDQYALRTDLESGGDQDVDWSRLVSTPSQITSLSSNQLFDALDANSKNIVNVDKLNVGAATTPTERIEVSSAIKIGMALGSADGTIRWTGSDFEGRKAGAWVSLTGANEGGWFN